MIDRNEMSDAMSSDVLECPRGENVLSDKQLAAIELLILGKKVKDVATAVGVERRTVTRWKVDELFREELEKRCGGVVVLRRRAARSDGAPRARCARIATS